jgi:oligoribonuclease NrnB/cAMP/cGMP phosphodiesterase (DHH superfamily)
MKKYNYVIYHKRCFDGFTGFLILHESKQIDRHALIYPDVPSATSIPQNLEGKNVIIIDCAYKYNILREIVRRAQHVTFIDHHITIYEDIQKLSKEVNNLTVYYDKKKSGASLTWKFFNHNKPLPLFVKFIEDNDIGKWEMKNVYEFITALSVKLEPTPTHQNLKEWKKLYSVKRVNELIKIGKVYMEYKNHISTEHSKRFSIEKFPSEKFYDDNTKLFKKPGQYTVAVYCGSACPSATDVANKIFDKYKCDFFISWVLNLDRKEYVLTFRSKEVDVGEIAKLFNGGGHTLAAAGSIKMDNFFIGDLFLNNSNNSNNRDIYVKK